MTATDQKDYYGALGVKRSASADDIRKAYRRLARKYHPDVNPGDRTAEDRFKSIQEAYDVLGDKKKREMYDQFGFYSETGAYSGAGAPGAGGFDFGGFDFSDFARQAGAAGRGGRQQKTAWRGGGFSDLFSQFFKQEQAQNAAQAKPGEDLEYSVDIDFWDAIKGTSLRLNVARQEMCGQCRGIGDISAGAAVCKECGGKGQVTQTVGAMRFNLACPRCQGEGSVHNVCPACGGDGRLSRTETVEVRIPPGAQTGSRLRVAGKGNIKSGGIVDNITKVVEGRADAAALAPGMPAVRKAHATVPGGIRFLPLGAGGTDSFLAREVPGAKSMVAKPSKRMPFFTKPTRIAAFDAYLNAGKQVSNEDAYKIIKVLHTRWKAMQKAYGPLRPLHMDKIAPATNPHPYHPGVINYLKEKGLWSAANEKQQKAVLAEIM